MEEHEEQEQRDPNNMQEASGTKTSSNSFDSKNVTSFRIPNQETEPKKKRWAVEVICFVCDFHF